jgi:hypothetical protein
VANITKEVQQEVSLFFDVLWKSADLAHRDSLAMKEIASVLSEIPNPNASFDDMDAFIKTFSQYIRTSIVGSSDVEKALRELRQQVLSVRPRHCGWWNVT